MIIYYTKDFKEVLTDPSRYIYLSKFKLTSFSGGIEKTDLNTIDTPSEEYTVSTSPTAGYYEAEGIISGSLLSLSISIPISDISIEDYTAIFLYYEDYSDVKDPQLACIIFGKTDEQEKESGKIYFGKLNLEPDRTIINVPGFNYNCSLLLNQDSDLDFLESKGMGIVYSLFLESGEIRDLGYVSRKSYEVYLLEQRGEDDYDHFYTQYINSYGLKIY